MVFADARLDPRTKATAAALEAISARAVLNMPVTERGGLVALLYLNHAEVREWPDEELAFVREMAERTRTAVARLTAERELRASEARYRTLFEAIDVGFCVVEMKFDDNKQAIDYRLAEINPAFERQTGLRGAAGQWVSEAAPGLERHWFDTYGRVALTGEPVRFENRAEPFGRWYDVHAFRAGEPQEHRVAILFNDITERRNAEDRLRELNETLEQQVAERTADRDRLWRSSQDMLLIARFDGTIVAANPAWTAILGWSEAELVGANFMELIHPDDLASSQAEAARLAAEGRTNDAVREPLSRQGREVGLVVLGGIVQRRALPCRRPRRHRRQGAPSRARSRAGGAPSVAEDGGGRPAHRRHRARLQQHARGRDRLARPARPAHRRRRRARQALRRRGERGGAARRRR